MLYHGLTYSGKRKYPIPAPFNNLVPSKGRGEETEALVKVIVQGTGSQKNRLQHRTEVYPPTHTQLITTTLTAIYYNSYPEHHMHLSTKITSHAKKKKKHSLKSLNEHENGSNDIGTKGRD